MILYEFLFNSCIYESGWITMSVHRTQEGALRAMYEHKKSEKKKYDDFRSTIPEEEKQFWTDYGFDVHKDWCVKEIELQD